MGLFNLFGKKEPASTSGQPTAIEYVEWLLRYMLCTSRTELTLDTRKALPAALRPQVKSASVRSRAERRHQPP
jgi:hypothetical protein